MALNPFSGRALYRQVADELRARIEGDNPIWGPGDELPSVADLEDEFEVGIQTIRSALKVLVREELIVSMRGQPHQVADRPEPVVIEVGPEADITGRAARPEDREAFGVPEGAYLLIVTEHGRERAYLARKTRIRYRR